ncbi:integrase arm-type DNA-binding domain-containing protein [Rhodoblastus sp. 17X3]|uniref:tyrosine-type recombinase/integrase n=1 Tax=Rhodoblastus sp. 17X3 TaxID=3047026 RepID=UPI0024B84677|nr:integrase arm-type DNA-binding domain-containing protein [Rhodoblastus sp. 17X3]MDI9848900.1 integrase arm-type DNA-binding domain-containing protein [Rhodoblastus sp. 17X3]
MTLYAISSPQLIEHGVSYDEINAPDFESVSCHAFGMKKNLSVKLLDNLKPRADRRYEVRDTSLPGFGIRVAVTGGKTWFVMGRVSDKQLRHTIGTYPIISLAEARNVARTILRDMQLGTYEKPEAKTKPATLGDVMKDFIDIYAKPKNRSWKSQQATLRKFASLEDRPIAEITRADVVKVLDQVATNGAPTGANHAMAVIKKLFAWALDRGVIENHPIAGMKAPAKSRSRDRILTDDEIKGLWAATADIGFPFGPAYQLLLLTGQRRGEVTGMKWSQLDFVRAVWTIPAEMAKNGRAHEVPLSSMALDIIKAIPKFVGSDYVFTTTGRTPISGFGRTKDRLDLAMGTGATSRVLIENEVG